MEKVELSFFVCLKKVQKKKQQQSQCVLLSEAMQDTLEVAGDKVQNPLCYFLMLVVHVDGILRFVIIGSIQPPSRTDSVPCG